MSSSVQLNIVQNKIDRYTDDCKYKKKNQSIGNSIFRKTASFEPACRGEAERVFANELQAAQAEALYNEEQVDKAFFEELKTGDKEQLTTIAIVLVFLIVIVVLLKGGKQQRK